MQYVNLTGHQIHEVTSNTVIEPVDRLEILSKTYTFKVNNIPHKETKIIGVKGMLPPKQRGTKYIVGNLVANAIVDRDDLVAPGNVYRNEKGQPIGCKGFRIVTNDNF